jgi:hypothetical protein
MQRTLRIAMLGFQLWGPKGWDGLMIQAFDTGKKELRVNSVGFAGLYHDTALLPPQLASKRCPVARSSGSRH